MVSFPALLDPLTDGIISLRPFADRDIPDVLIAYQDAPELHLRLGVDRAGRFRSLATPAT